MRKEQPTEDKRKTTLFLTSARELSPPQPLTKVIELHDKLNSLVDSLQGKVDDVVCRNQAEFFTAYKRHIDKVRRELQEIKQKSRNQEKALNSNARMKQLEKQIIIFREEALILYDKLKQKDEDYDELKMRYDEATKENAFLNDQLKKNMKKHRNIQADLLAHLQPEISHIFSQTSVHTQTSPQQRSIPKQTISQFRSTRNNRLASLNMTMRENTSRTFADSDYRQIFIECVETVRRQVYKRRVMALPAKSKARVQYGSMYTNGKRENLTSKLDQHYRQPSSQQFHNKDKEEILNLLINNQKAGNAIRNLIFGK